jgi:hypothetical protein
MKKTALFFCLALCLFRPAEAGRTTYNRLTKGTFAILCDPGQAASPQDAFFAKRADLSARMLRDLAIRLKKANYRPLILKYPEAFRLEANRFMLVSKINRYS